MPHQFTFVLSMSTISLVDAVYSVERGLARHGYVPGLTVSRMDLSDTPGLSGHTEAKVPFVASQQGGIAGWLALSVEFFADVFGIKVSMLQWDQESMNIYVDVNVSVLSRKPRAENFDLFVLAVVDIARSVGAFGGVGGFSFELNKIIPSMLYAAILDSPANVGFPSEMGLVKSSEMDERAVRSMADGLFKVEAYGDYWLLLENDFLPLIEAGLT